MKYCKKAILLLLLCLPCTALQAEPSSMQQDSVLVEMFKWWNAAIREEAPFTRQGFAQFFTDDIVFVINNRRSPKGLDSLTERFNKIKESYHVIEIILPMQEEFRSGNKLFTYHLNRGKTEAGGPWSKPTHIMGWVELKDGKIDFLNFLHYNEDSVSR